MTSKNEVGEVVTLSDELPSKIQDEVYAEQRN